jgi:hypothetical protein
LKIILSDKINVDEQMCFFLAWRSKKILVDIKNVETKIFAATE